MWAARRRRRGDATSPRHTSSRTAPTRPEEDVATEISTPPQAPDTFVMAAAIKEALPYIARFVGKTIVVKIGGSIHGDGTALEDIVTLARLGVMPVVVHGGGPMITEWQGRMGLEPKFVDEIGRAHV